MKIIFRYITFLLISGLFLTGCQKETSSFSPNLTAPTANAGPSQSIQIPVTSVILNGSGHSDNGPIVGYLWSLVSGPNVPAILSPSSPTTVVNNLVAGN